MVLKTLIVDDEPLARKRLKGLLKPHVEAGKVDLVGEISDAQEALAYLKEHPVDLLLLDIQMPEMDGFDLIEALPEKQQPLVVFVTAYDEYAIQAFEVHALDYLLKPVTPDRLAKALARAEDQIKRKVAQPIPRLLDWLEQEKAPVREEPRLPEYPDYVTVGHREKLRVIPVDRIVSAEVHDGITSLYVWDDDRLTRYIVEYTLDYLEKRLNPDRFMRVHRSAIVHIPSIQEIIPWFSGRHKLILKGAHEVIASRERSRLLKKRLSL